MEELIFELKTLNESVQRLIDFFIPAQDPKIFDEFKALKVVSRNSRLALRGIADPDPIRFSELRGIDSVIQNLRENTEHFIEGLPCNNVLLHGPRGTGKSSAIKATLNEYAERGLRMVEMPRDTLLHLFAVADVIRGRHERFIAFCDDLSFEKEETGYRELKAVLEGGLETKPANMLIYATSNRRHLMPESQKDNLPVYAAGELHPTETLEEKISLSDRFGLRIGMLNFDAETYLDIVNNYVIRRGITIDFEDLKSKALQWSLSHGSYSGRTARQFIDDLEGRMRFQKKMRGG
ncbi:MAG: ATP-binding protein [Thermodesulfovibrionales bacterium]|jgi:predicted AAA+ superfamily ATPase